MNTYDTYVTGLHRDKPRFLAFLNLVTTPLAENAELARNLSMFYDIDNATGVQLDAIGEWVGLSRFQTTPITGVFFSWNDTTLTGWNSGSWKGPYEPSVGVIELDDTAYRIFLKSKIGANYWHGSNESLNAICQELLADFGGTCFVKDNMDMTVTVYVTGALPAVMIEVIKRSVAHLKPAGVKITGFVFS